MKLSYEKKNKTKNLTLMNVAEMLFYAIICSMNYDTHVLILFLCVDTSFLEMNQDTTIFDQTGTHFILWVPANPVM